MVFPLAIVALGLAASGLGTSGFTILIAHLKHKRDQGKKFAKTKEQNALQKKQLQTEFLLSMREMNMASIILDKKGKWHVCFLGPISVGKSSLCNNLFGCKQEVGLGECTKEATVVHQNLQKVFWDAKGVNSDWDEYLEDDVRFFRDMDQVYLLYCSSIKDIRFIGQMLTSMNVDIILVRTKCDDWKQGMKAIDVVLVEDSQMAQSYKIKFSNIISVGKYSLELIKSTL